MVAPVVALYSPIVLLKFVTNRCPPDSAMAVGESNPEEMKELLMVAPVVASYSPIVLLRLLRTKIWARPVMGIRLSGATTAARRTAATARESGLELDLVSVLIRLFACVGFCRNSQPCPLDVRVALPGSQVTHRNHSPRRRTGVTNF